MRKIGLVIVALVFVLVVSPTQAAYQGQISGTFNGWTGDTIHKLMDGHIIQQAEYHYHYAYSPEVIIYSSGGGYKIRVLDDDGDQDVGIRILR